MTKILYISIALAGLLHLSSGCATLSQTQRDEYARLGRDGGQQVIREGSCPEGTLPNFQGTACYAK